jgi:hypothetical protein
MPLAPRPRCDRNACRVLLIAAPLPLKSEVVNPLEQPNPTQWKRASLLRPPSEPGLRLSKLVPKICHYKATLFLSRESLLSNTYCTRVPVPRLRLVVIRRCGGGYFLFIHMV